MNNFTHLRTFLENFVRRFNPALTDYLNQKEREIVTHDPVGAELIGDIKHLAEGGGKRIRAALVELGFRNASGYKDDNQILLPAIAMELAHTFFLIHDDIMDRSATRRGKPTVHENVKSRHRNLVRASDLEHFAHSMAILAGDLCCAISYEALTSSRFPEPAIIRATRCLHTMINATVTGQVLDMITPLKGGGTEEMVRKIHLLKTAKYTLEGPLHLGLVLGGARSQTLTRTSEYAIPVGIAFQIQDDILGLFGTEENLGKPTTSDIREGKQTLMTAFVFERGTTEQRNRFAQILGKPDASEEELLEARSIIAMSGALEYAEEQAKTYSLQGKKALEATPFSAEDRKILKDLADFVIHRNV